MTAQAQDTRTWHATARWLIGAGLMLLGLAVIIFVVGSVWQCPRASAYPQDCPTPTLILSPSLTALGFLATAFIAWRTRRPLSVVAYFWLGSMALATGLFSGAGTLAAGTAFNVALVWLAPISLRSHLTLLGRPLKPGERALALTSVALAVAWTAPFLAYFGPLLPARTLIRSLWGGVLLTLVLTLLLVPVVLWRGYRAGLAPAAARQIRFVAIGSSLAFAPLALLSILPGLLGSSVQAPYEATFPWLLLSPLSHLYTFYRSRLARIEPLIDRSAVVFLLTVCSLAAYLITRPLVLRLEIPSDYRLVAVTAALLLGILLFRRLERMLTAFVLWPFEGDQPSGIVIDRLTEVLSFTTERAALRQLLLERLPQTLRAFPEVLALRTPGQELALQYTAHWTPAECSSWHMSVEGVLAGRLVERARPVTSYDLRSLPARRELTLAEARLLEMQPGWLLLPLVSGGSLQGILVMAGRADDDPWRNEDLDTLTILGRQVGAATHNLLLLEQVRAGRAELAHVHRQFMMSQERQQRQLAQNLHDSAVQHLLGISYQLAEAQRRSPLQSDTGSPTFEEIRAEVLAVSGQLRKVIGQLRPAGLDEVGLVAALEGYVARVQREAGPQAPVIRLHLDRRGAFLPEAVSICLFRTAQEGIRNALAYACARRVDIDLRIEGDAVALSVQDDGCGFLIPERLSELAQADHFGLVGVAERVAWIGGQFEIQSQPTKGVAIRVSLPLTPSEESDEQRDQGGVGG